MCIVDYVIPQWILYEGLSAWSHTIRLILNSTKTVITLVGSQKHFALAQQYLAFWLLHKLSALKKIYSSKPWQVILTGYTNCEFDEFMLNWKRTHVQLYEIFSDFFFLRQSAKTNPRRANPTPTPCILEFIHGRAEGQVNLFLLEYLSSRGSMTLQNNIFELIIHWGFFLHLPVEGGRKKCKTGAITKL